MGVDISGKNPIIRSPKHDYPNWNEMTQAEKDAWFEMDEKWHNEILVITLEVIGGGGDQS